MYEVYPLMQLNLGEVKTVGLYGTTLFRRYFILHFKGVGKVELNCIRYRISLLNVFVCFE